MNRKHDNLILQILSSNKPQVILSVVGDSMQPVIFENDKVKIKKSTEYHMGDILVFRYKDNNIYMHRLLKIVDDIYYCKGDNSFRLEDVKYAQIYGKVVEIIHNGNVSAPPTVNEAFLQMSYQVNREFKRLKYDKIKILESDIYQCYYNEYLTNI